MATRSSTYRLRWLAGCAPLFCCLAAGAGAQTAPAQPDRAAILIEPERVFDGVDGTTHPGWRVLVRGDRIVAVGPDVAAPAGATVLSLPGTTLMPGMIDAHVHLFLHPYNETSWNDQVLKEPLALRVARATAAARATLLAGFTTVRDLGTEGAGYADVGLKAAIDQHIIYGPRMIVARSGTGACCASSTAGRTAAMATRASSARRDINDLERGVEGCGESRASDGPAVGRRRTPDRSAARGSAPRAG